MSSNVLAAKDVNTSMSSQPGAPETDTKPDVMSMEYHRQVFQSKMDQGEYVLAYPSGHFYYESLLV